MFKNNTVHKVSLLVFFFFFSVFTVVNIVMPPKMSAMVIKTYYFNLIKEETLVFYVKDIRVDSNKNLNNDLV